MQEEAASLDNQIKQCKEYAKKKGYKVLGVYSDVMSGTKDDRENYQKVKELIEVQAFDTLIVYEMSRISRKSIELLKFTELMKEKGINFVSVTEASFDTTTPEGALMANIQFGMIQYERDNTAKRTTERLYYKAKEGQWIGGKPPRGYKLVNKNLKIDNVEAEVIRGIFRDYVNGSSLNQISIKYNLRWKASRVKRILQNITYKGWIQYGKRGKNDTIVVKGKHEAIVSEKVFDEVQELLKLGGREKNSKNNKYLLAGLLKCKLCGHNYVGVYGDWYSGNAAYGCHLKRLKTTDKEIYGGQDCNSGNIKKEFIEKIVMEELRKLIHSLKSIDNISNIEVEVEGKEDTNLEKEILILEKKIETLLEVYLEGDISKENYKIKNQDLKLRLELLKRKLDKEIKIKKPHKMDIKNRDRIISYFNKINPKNAPETNYILSMIIDRIEIYKPKTRRQDDFEIEIYFNII